MFVSFHQKMFIITLLAITLAAFVSQSDAISTYWMPIIPSFCSPKVSQNVTQALLACDTLMDPQVKLTNSLTLNF